MPISLPTADFLQSPGVVLDVRSPGEYEQGHIPGAISFPLFSNEERAEVGTCYKQEGRDRAVELGFEIVGPKCASFVKRAKQLAPDRQVRVHCWRGGMRSESIAWILQMAGLQVSVLQGGYKAFRQWARSTFASPRQVVILGGMTGSGKTEILTALAEQQAQVLDLEALANHRGSSYGALGLPPQPSNEQFENLLAMKWAELDASQPVWIEGESKRIGLCRIPPEVFQQMDQAPVIEVVRSRAERVDLLVEVYGNTDAEGLVTATERLRKKLGGLRTQQAVDSIRQGNLAEAVNLVLDYYDKTYRFDLNRRQVPIYPVNVAGLSAAESATLLLTQAQQIISTHGKPIQPPAKTESAIV
jgi:tRNA 2-selenouridine synthase